MSARRAPTQTGPSAPRRAYSPVVSWGRRDVGESPGGRAGGGTSPVSAPPRGRPADHRATGILVSVARLSVGRAHRHRAHHVGSSRANADRTVGSPACLFSGRELG